MDRGGTRWLMPKSGAPVPSPFGAPEGLLAARQDGAGFAFIGESGTVYLAAEPLGPLTEVRPPPVDAHGVAVHQEVILVVGSDGRLQRSADLGRTWAPVPVDGFVTAAALDERGRALALAVPERWFWSTDRGATFRAIHPGTVAPARLAGGGPRILVDGWLGLQAFDGQRFVPEPVPPKGVASWALPRAPGAGDVRAGSAALGADVALLVQERGQLALLHGELGATPEPRVTSGLEGCARFRLARSGKKVAVLCAERAETGGSAVLSLRLGDVETARFRTAEVALRGDFEAARLALAPSGTVALSGVCPEQERDAGCTPRGLHLVKIGERKLAQVAATFEEAPLALAFAADERLHAATVREKDAHALLAMWPPGAPDLGVFLDVSAAVELRERATAVELLPSADGMVGILVHHGSEVTTASIAPSGELVTTGKVPSAAVAVHGAGLRLAAVSPLRRVLFESMDGGVTWAEAALPRALCPAERGDCKPPVVCGDGGCLIGEELTRVGWGAADARLQREAEPARGAVAAPHAGEFVCRLESERALELPHLLEVPGAAEAALGDADFTAVEFDAKTAALGFVWVKRGERRLERAVGFAPTAEPERYALAIQPQVEGTAALRYRTPLRTTGDRMLSEIEVAWNNRISGAAARQRFPQLIESKQGDYHTGASGPSEALPELLSVAGTGVYLALHRADTAGQVRYYFRPDGYEVLPAPRLPAALDDPGDSEYVRLGSEHAPLAFSPDRARVFLGGGGAHPDGSVALLLGMAPTGLGRAQGLRLAYRGDRIGTVSMMADVDGTYWAAYFAELGGPDGAALGDIVRVPLKPALQSPPHACSDAVRRSTPRIVAPAFPGATPNLRVLRGSERVAGFTLTHAVLHGTPESACLAAWEGEPTGATAKDDGGVLLLPTASGLFGWFFNAKGGARSQEGFEALPLSCVHEG